MSWTSAWCVNANDVCALASDPACFRQGDVHISYLPLAHIYERVIIYTCIHTGTGVRARCVY